MNHVILKIAALVICIVFFPLVSNGKVITDDTVWRSTVVVEEDVLVPEGVTLTILPGTVINIMPSDRTKTDPEYFSSLPEITVRGRLEIEGNDNSPVSIHIKKKNDSEQWAGIIIDGGEANIRSCTIEDAETGILVLKGSLNLRNSFILNNRFGLVAQGSTTNVRIENTEIIENDYGVFELNNVKVTYRNSSIQENSKKDIYWYGSKRRSTKGIKNRRTMSSHKRSGRSCRRSTDGLVPDYLAREMDTTKQYKDEVLLGDTIWRGRIEIDGLIRVPENVRLIILPGTIVEFKKRDTNNDNIGENGLLMQGVLIAKGTEENPIIFRSAEKERRRGDWDAINIINSDGAQNLVEFVLIEDAYRGLHFHFSNVLVSSSVIQNSYRAIQFQESSVEIRGNYFIKNKSGVKARDSRIVFENNHVFDNINGVNFFRNTLTARRNNIFNNINEGVKIREGTTVIRENLIECNRYGLMVNDSFFGEFSSNIVSHNSQTGIALKGGDNIDLNKNFIQGNGFNGIDILNSGAVIKENNISENGQRGIGIQSFSGTITDNIIVKNKIYAIENESRDDILAPMNWWGYRRTAKAVCDKFDDSIRGVVIYSPARREPVPYPWPFETLHTDTAWHGAVAIRKSLNVIDGAVLTIAPGTKVVFSEGAGLNITESKIVAAGKEDKRILFTSLKKKPDYLWDEILLEYASGSLFKYADFEYATWAVHSHFTDLKITNAEFRKNQGGMRFRSGPVEISESLFTENRIGLRAFMATALIKDNEFTKNETGIFVREKGDGLTIRNNNFYSNIDYNIRVGDFNLEDIDARGNWWGTDIPEETIFDGRREPGVGKVIFDPILEEKIVFGDEEALDKEKEGESKAGVKDRK